MVDWCFNSIQTLANIVFNYCLSKKEIIFNNVIEVNCLLLFFIHAVNAIREALRAKNYRT